MIRLALLVALMACTAPVERGERRVAAEPAPTTTWPSRDLTFVHPVLEVPPELGTPGVFVSAGHGAPDNLGNLGSRCIREQDFTLEAATVLARRLSATGVFDVTSARTGAQRPTYHARLAQLRRSRADVLIELHSDARGHEVHAVGVAEDGQWCFAATDSPGLSILVSDEGPDALNADRLALARSVARALGDVGFLLYEGGYGDLYDEDEQPGVYIDRRGLMMLRRPTVPSILIETHNAYDPREARRWTEPRTHDAFGRAVLAGLLRYFGELGASAAASP